MPVYRGLDSYDEVARAREQAFIDQLRREEMLRRNQDLIDPRGAFNDTKTDQQYTRDRMQNLIDRELSNQEVPGGNTFSYPQTMEPWIGPKSDPRMMPNSGTRYPGIMANPDYPEYQQLMDFYTNENI